MPLKPPIPDAPYLPTLGINNDADSLSVNPQECIDSKNLRHLPYGVKTRAGSKKISKNTPSSDEIIHYHSWKEPDGITRLFGFTANDIYSFNRGTDLWEYALRHTVLDDCEAVADWDTDLASGISLHTIPIEGTYGIAGADGDAATTSLGDNMVGKSGAAAMSWDLSSYTHVTMYLKSLSIVSSDTANVAFKAEFYDNDDYTSLLEDFTFTLTTYDRLTTVPEYTKVTFEITTPASWTTVQSFRILANQATLPGTGNFLVVDYIIGHIRSPEAIELWHTTDYLDDDEGATIIAAGSQPPARNESEDDGANRVLYYYDTTNDYFDTLTTTHRLVVANEDSGQTGGGAGGTATDASIPTAMSAGDTIVPGYFFISTAEDGIIATCSTQSISVDSGGAAADGYLLQEVTSGDLTEGENSSWVKTDGTWKLTFVVADYNGKKLYLTYTYSTAYAYNPRFVWNFHNRLLLANTYEGTTYHPWRLRWTQIADMDLLVDTNYYDLVDTDVTSIVGGDFQGFYLNIYKQESIAQASHVGGTSIFSFITVEKTGTYAGRTLQTYNNLQFYLGEDDVYLWDGSKKRSITEDQQGNTRIRRKLLDYIDEDKLNTAFGSLYHKYHEYWLWICKEGDTYPTAVFIYNIRLGVWYYFEFPETSAVGSYFYQQDTTIDELIGTIDEQYWKLGGTPLSGTTEAVIFARSSGGTEIMDESIVTDGGYLNPSGTWVLGSDISSHLITRDFIFNDLHRKDRCTRMIFEGSGGGDIEVRHSNSYGTDINAFKNATDITVSSRVAEYQYFPDAHGRQIRFSFKSSSPMVIRWIQPYAILEEQFSK